MEDKDTSFLVEWSISVDKYSEVQVNDFNPNHDIDQLIDVINTRVTDDAMESLEYMDCVQVDQFQVKEVAKEIWEYFQEKKAMKAAKEKQGVLFE